MGNQPWLLRVDLLRTDMRATSTLTRVGAAAREAARPSSGGEGGERNAVVGEGGAKGDAASVAGGVGGAGSSAGEPEAAHGGDLEAVGVQRSAAAAKLHSNAAAVSRGPGCRARAGIDY